jgi:hypothetical protein
MAVMDVAQLKAIKHLLDECAKCGSDTLGYIHYVPKEIYDDAQREYDLLVKSRRKGQTR